MPRVTLTPENKKANPFDYPKLFLEKGERARVVMIEPEPIMEYCHTMRAPKLDGNGDLVTRSVTRKGGETEDVPDYEFVGRHVCIGDVTAIDQRGSDPDGCPVCEAAKKSDAVSAPDRRFGTHLIRYALKPGSFEIQEPFQVTLIAWTFSDKVFNDIVDIATEWGDLRQRDLLLGPCEVKQFQKFDINVASKAEWLATNERKEMVKEVFKSNQTDNMSQLIARKLTREQILEDLGKVLTAHQIAFQTPKAATTTTNGSTPATDEVPSAGEMDLDDLLGDGGEKKEEASAAEQSTAEATEETPAAETEEKAETESSDAPKGETLDLDDLLGD